MRLGIFHQGLHAQSRPFRVAYWSQRAWDWRIAFYLFLAGASGGLIFVELVLRGLGIIDERTAVWGGWLGIILAALSLIVLFSHLGPGARWRAWNVFRNVRKSWISRGAVIVTVLMGLRIVVMLPSIASSLPWGDGTAAGTALRICVMVFALAFMVYSGLVLSSWNSIAFWNSPMLPVLYTGYSFLGGVAILPMIALITVGRTGLDSMGTVLWPILLALLLGSGFLLTLYIAGMATASLPARESVRRLTRGEARMSFWLGVVLLGLAAPVVVVALPVSGALGAGTAATAVLVIACACILVGGYVLRDVVLATGVYGPPV